MVETAFELMEYLTERGAPYGISAQQIFEQIPANARSPKVAYEFMQLKDISHIEPLSKGGNPAGDNWLLEDSSTNRARGAQTMTTSEQTAAKADAVVDANGLLKAGATGAALATGVAVAESVLVAGEVIALTPIIATVTVLGGGIWLANEAWKRFS